MLFFLGAWFLLKNEVIHFNWTDRLIREYAYKKAKKNDHQKVLVLGDSQLEKWPMKHCLYKDLADYFDDNVIGYLNAAHYGFGPIEYEDQLSKIIPHYKPDIILICYYAGNDLTDVSYRSNNLPLERTYDVIFEESAKKESVTKKKVSEDLDFEESSNSLQDFNWDLFEEKGVDPDIIQFAKNRIAHPNEIGPEYVNPHIVTLGVWKPDNHYDNCTMTSVSSNYAWYRSLQKFEGIMTLADSIGALVVIIVIPSNVQVDSSHYDFYRKTKFRINDDLLFSNAPQQVLYEFSKASKIAYLDLLPFFKSYQNIGELYFINDDHLSEKGHVLAFNVIKDRMLEPLFHQTQIIEQKKRKTNVYLKFKKSVVRHQMEIIKADSAWYSGIREKALENNVSVDSQLHLDAIFVLNN